MKKIALVIAFLVGITQLTFSQGYIEHTVKEGESIAAIVKQYEVSPYELYDLNPDAKDGIQPGSVLVFLRNKNYPYDPTFVDLKRHKVKKKETLFGIAQDNNISVDNLKKYNPKLYADEVKKGMVLKIPVFDESLAQVEETNNTTVDPKEIQHIVKTKETKYGIAHHYHITIADLEEWNPHIKDGLQVGQLLTIKSIKEENVEATIIGEEDNKFTYYQVQAKEGFFRLEKKLGISKDSLISLNPQLEDGIKLGMILKYPKSDLMLINRPSFNLIDSISSAKKQTITLLLPFMLDKMKQTDSTSNIKKLLVRENNALNKSIDFYSGVRMALDSLQKVGVSTKLNVFDTEFSSDKEANKNRIQTILNKTYEENEIVIGPLVTSNVIETANYLKDKNIPVVAPYTLKEAFYNDNLYQSEASDIQLRDAMITYLEKYVVDKNVILVADDKLKDLKELLIAKFPQAKLVKPREGGLLIPKDFIKLISKDKENVVIVESSSQGAVSTTISVLDTFLKDNKISVFTTSSKKWFDTKGVRNRYKAKLNLHVPSSTKACELNRKDSFIKKYYSEYGKLPNKYAIRGFDVTMDAVLRQLIGTNLEEGVLQIGETSYLDSKFNYMRAADGGYKNAAIYILRYTPEFTLEEMNTSILNEVETENTEE